MNHNPAEYARRSIDGDALREFLARVPAHGRVLVAGCGDGAELAAIAEAGFTAEGFDASEEEVERARKRAPTAERVWRADARLLSVPRETFDGIWAHGLFRVLDPPSCQRTLAGFFAALRRGGALFASIETPLGELPDGQSFERGKEGTYLYPRAEFASLLRQSGFQLGAEGSPIESPTRVGFVARRI